MAQPQDFDEQHLELLTVAHAEPRDHAVFRHLVDDDHVKARVPFAQPLELAARLVAMAVGVKRNAHHHPRRERRRAGGQLIRTGFKSYNYNVKFFTYLDRRRTVGFDLVLCHFSLRYETMTHRLRIAIFLNEFPALSETFVVSQITGLIDLGHVIKIFARGARKNEPLHIDVTRYDLINICHYPKISKYYTGRLFDPFG